MQAIDSLSNFHKQKVQDPLLETSPYYHLFTYLQLHDLLLSYSMYVSPLSLAVTGLDARVQLLLPTEWQVLKQCDDQVG